MKAMCTTPKFIVLTLALALTGCVSPYEKFYKKVITPEDEVFLLPYSGHTEYVSSPLDDIANSQMRIEEKGYQLIGYSFFEANAGDYNSSLTAKAAEIQADVVLVSSKNAGTLDSFVPIINYSPGQNSTTYASGVVNATARNNYGASAYGTANYSGTSTTTSPGSFNTSYLPIQVQRSENQAIFFRKRFYQFGAFLDRLPTELSQKLERNAGLVVRVVVESSPAFVANILVGDILVTIDDEPIISVDEFMMQVDRKAGQNVAIGILRHEKPKTIQVQLKSFAKR